MSWALFSALVLTAAQSAWSQTLTTLYSFTGGQDGGLPVAGVATDAQGNLFGTTEEGGEQNKGTVFEVSPDGTETVLYSFCSQAGCSDGRTPLYGSLVTDAQGDLYGTTDSGGAYDGGTVFKLTLSGTETVLHSFHFIYPPSAPRPGRYSDGEAPYEGLVFDAQGNLYGTTDAGGEVSPACQGCGTVFKVSATGQETLLYSFA